MDTKSISNSPIDPAGDSRPIRFEALLEHEIELIRQANRLLRGMHKDAKQYQDRTSFRDPWAPVDHHRSYRTLMISGPRGSGKTSIMLTLLAGWRAAWMDRRELWEAIADSKHQEEAEELFRPMADVVRPLKPLDFDPLPPDLPLYGWIVQAFLPLVECLEQDGQAAWEAGLERDRHDTMRSRDRLPWSGQSRSLREQWQDLYQAAVVGWGTGKLREAFQKDLYDLMLEQGEQHLNWQKLQDKWKRFLDDLFQELDQNPKVFPQGGLLVLPIDDADLQIERDRELIFAVRLLHHPHVVYLLTGDKDNLQENLSLDFLSRMIGSFSFGYERFFDVNDERSQKLASDLVKKVLSPLHVLDMGPLNLSQIFEWNDKEPDKPLDKIFHKDGFSLRQFFEKRPEELEFFEDYSSLLFRTLQQFKDRYAQAWNSNQAPDLANFLVRLEAFLKLLESNDKDEFTVGRSKEQIDLHTYPGPIIPVVRLYQSARSSPHIEVRVGVELEFKQAWISEEPKRLVQASQLTLLALDLVVEAPHVYVLQHASRIRPPQCLAWSIYRAPYVIWLPWPSIEAKSPTETVRQVEDWARDVRNIGHIGVDKWVDRIAFTWIRLHLLWLGADKERLPKPLRTDSDTESTWEKLFQSFQSLEDEVERSTWFQLELPLLTAPEYGLSKSLQDRLLHVLMERQGIQELPEEWQEFRRKSIDTATKFTQEIEPVDWFEVNPYDSERAVPDSVFDLLEEMQKAFPDSPWSHEPPQHKADVE
jgi:hypothetical protein